MNEKRRFMPTACSVEKADQNTPLVRRPQGLRSDKSKVRCFWVRIWRVPGGDSLQFSVKQDHLARLSSHYVRSVHQTEVCEIRRNQYVRGLRSSYREAENLRLCPHSHFAGQS